MVRLWDIATGKNINTLIGHTGGIHSVAFSPDGSILASGGSDATRLWDVTTGKNINTLIGYMGRAESVSFSPDGSILASGGSKADSFDATVRLWDVATGENINTLTWNMGDVHSVAFSPDSSIIACGDRLDPTVRLWDVATGENTNIFTANTGMNWGHTGGVWSVSFSPDGTTLASSGIWDGTVLLWDLTPTAPESKRITEDINGDGVVNIIDLTLVASDFGKTGQNSADVNGDGVINIIDLTLVAGAFGNTAAAPEIWSHPLEVTPTRTDLEVWLRQARQVNLTDPAFRHGILILEQLLATLTPKETILLPNYPNPFNPETWIPYYLANPSDVKITIYDTRGSVVRQLNLGHQHEGYYTSQSRTAYWDGRNDVGEPVASGIYFYQLQADNLSFLRKMLILK